MTLKKKNKAGELSLPEFCTKFKATVSKQVSEVVCQDRKYINETTESRIPIHIDNWLDKI